jgi:hypothetical protein
MKRQRPRTIYQQMERFADITQTYIIQGNLTRAKKCLGIAENIFLKGNREIKTAITNVYVYSVSSFMELHHCSIRNLFPQYLQNEYYKQVNTFGV